MSENTFINKNWNKVKRTPCQIYSRVSGFITPVSNYNIGKKSEFYSRKFYSTATSLNSKFVEDYSCGSEMEVNYNIIKASKVKVGVCASC